MKTVGDFDILKAKFILTMDFSNIQEEFEKLCELGNLEALQYWYKLYSIGDNLYIDDMVEYFEVLPQYLVSKKMSKQASLETSSHEYIKLGKEIVKSSIKLEAIKNGDKSKSDRTQLFTQIIDQRCLYTDEFVKELLDKLPNHLHDSCALTACISAILSGKTNNTILDYVKLVANKPYSVDLNEYKLKRKPVEKDKAPLVKCVNHKECSSIFEETLLYWNKLTKAEKIKHLQLYEELNAKIHSRDEREIFVPKEFDNTEFDDTSIIAGTYDRSKPNIITISPIALKEFDAIQVLNTTYHEGYHALFHDFITDKRDLKTFENYGSNEEFIEKYKDTLLTALILFRSFPKKKKEIETYIGDYNYEEQVAYKESLIFAVYNLLKIADVKSTIRTCLDKYLLIISGYFDHCMRMQKLPVSSADMKKAKENRHLADSTLNACLDVPITSKVKRFPMISNGDERLISKIIREQNMQLTTEQLDVIIKLIDSALKHIKKREIYNIAEEFSEASKIF